MVWQISSKAAWREKHLSLSMGELGTITITCYCLPEDYETWLQCCQYLPAWKYCSPIWHGALRSPRICFSLESGNCSQCFIPAGQATLKHASTNLSPCQVMSWSAICNAASLPHLLSQFYFCLRLPLKCLHRTHTRFLGDYHYIM